MGKKFAVIISFFLILLTLNYTEPANGIAAAQAISQAANGKEDFGKAISPTSFNGIKDPAGNINVLIIGADSLEDGQARADAIMIAQYNPHNKMGKIASIMRDCYVEIPDYHKRFNKINSAYSIGGPELLRKTIKHNFNIDVEHYMVVDFNGFIQVIDILSPEGIEVNLDKNIIDHMGINAQPGLQKIHGNELLAYVRFRHDAESDFGRVKRQQEIITSLKNTIVAKLATIDGVFKLPALGTKVLQHIDTDMSFKDFVHISGNILLNQVDEIETIRIPVSASFLNKRYRHAGQVLELDFIKNKQALKEFLVEEPTPVNKEKSKLIDKD